MQTTTIIVTAEAECRDFAREFPTPATLRAIALCENGTLTWEQVHGLFHKALAAGLDAVR